MPCEDDFDCPLGLICYEEVGWSDEKYICSCNHYYGWSGENCTDLGGQTYYFITMSVLEIAICSIVLLICMKNVLDAIVSKTNVPLNSTTVGWLWSTMGLVSCLLWTSFELIAALSPNKHTRSVKIDSTKTNKKYPETVIYDRVLSSFMFIFTCNAVLMVSVVWLSVAYQVRKMVIGESSKLDQYKYGNYLVQTIFAIMVLSMISTARYDLVGILAVPFLLIIVVLYSLGRWRLGRVFDKLHNDSSGYPGGLKSAALGNPVNSDVHLLSHEVERRDIYKKMAKGVRNTSTTVIAAAYVLVISAFIFSVVASTPSQGSYTKPGSFDVQFFFSNILLLCILVILVTINQYTSEVFRESGRFTNGKTSAKSNNSILDSVRLSNEDVATVDKSDSQFTPPIGSPIDPPSIEPTDI